MTTHTRSISLTVNGVEHQHEVPVRMLLSDFIRHEIGQTGTHVGCEQGVCGACTIVVDGVAIRSCLMLAVQADGTSVETVESLADGEELSSFQQAMKDQHGLQCGFCTPGILMSVSAARRCGLSAEETENEVLGGHVCRCTGYASIRAAIQQTWTEAPQ